MILPMMSLCPATSHKVVKVIGKVPLFTTFPDSALINTRCHRRSYKPRLLLCIDYITVSSSASYFSDMNVTMKHISSSGLSSCGVFFGQHYSTKSIVGAERHSAYSYSSLSTCQKIASDTNNHEPNE